MSDDTELLQQLIRTSGKFSDGQFSPLAIFPISPGALLMEAAASVTFLKKVAVC